MIERIQFISQESEGYTHLESIRLACKAGVKWVQLRIKDKAPEEVGQQAVEAAKICRQYGARLIINDFPEIAKAVGAYGVHLGKEDMPIAAAREIVGDMILGATANTLDDIRAHSSNGADYVGLGPFRFTATKKKLSPILGQEGYRKLLQECREMKIEVPIIAIGGIELEDVPAILATGVYGIAVSSLIAKAAAPKEIVAGLYEEIQKKNFSHAYNR